MTPADVIWVSQAPRHISPNEGPKKGEDEKIIKSPGRGVRGLLVNRPDRRMQRHKLVAPDYGLHVIDGRVELDARLKKLNVDSGTAANIRQLCDFTAVGTDRQERGLTCTR